MDGYGIYLTSGNKKVVHQHRFNVPSSSQLPIAAETERREVVQSIPRRRRRASLLQEEHVTHQQRKEGGGIVKSELYLGELFGMRGWQVERRYRLQKNYPQMTDLFYYHPVSLKQFRSMKAVKKYLGAEGQNLPSTKNIVETMDSSTAWILLTYQPPRPNRTKTSTNPPAPARVPDEPRRGNAWLNLNVPAPEFDE